MILRGNVYSKVLEMNTGITIVAPSAMKSRDHYRVAYVLHGLCGNNGDWADFTMLPIYAINYDTIFIMPEVARSFYTDMKYGLKYFSYITEELPNISKRVFNISAKREDTAIMGASMGGYGALKCALSKPEQYGICCAFSSGCLFIKEFLGTLRPTKEDIAKREEIYGEQLVNDFQSIFGEDFEWNRKYDILELAKEVDNQEIKPKIYMACGTKDYLAPDNIRFRKEMAKLNFDYTYEEWEGAHDWYFFNEALNRALQKML